MDFQTMTHAAPLPSDISRKHSQLHSALERDLIEHHVYFVKNLGFTYIMNPKAACSTVLKSIFNSSWAYYEKGPVTIFEKDVFADETFVRELQDKPIISLVRNPYARALSGYLNKIAVKDSPQYLSFVERFFDGRAPSGGISFEQFLTCVAFEHPRRIDEHFRPQYLNLMLLHVTYDRLFSVENIESLSTFLISNNVVPVPEFRHFTGAAEGAVKAQHYNDSCRALVAAIYKNDFELLGYPLELERSSEAPSIEANSNIKFGNDDMIDFMTGVPCKWIDREHQALHAFNHTEDDGLRLEIGRRYQSFDDHWILASFVSKFDSLDPQLSHQIAGRIEFLRTRHLSYLR